MLDSYVDRFIGVEGQTRRIKRDLKESDDLKLLFNILQMATREYKNIGDSNEISQTETTSTTTVKPADHQIEKRSPIDYIEPILSLASKAYNEYMDPGLKKNFEKPPSIR
ncbi:uncharacterized protein LOC143194080 [Rhynchophorus ferrugineus]|uniref:uncharacterized protein LOC143194080 n=1 Tax=Rhynchophorus ferrugineus TaxID=354439 RepID=UPI003FCEE288